MLVFFFPPVAPSPRGLTRARDESTAGSPPRGPRDGRSTLRARWRPRHERRYAPRRWRLRSNPAAKPLEGAGTSRAVESSPGSPSSTDVARPASPSDAGLRRPLAPGDRARAPVSTIAPRVRARARSPARRSSSPRALPRRLRPRSAGGSSPPRPRPGGDPRRGASARRDAFPAPPTNRPDAAMSSPRASRAATTAPATTPETRRRRKKKRTKSTRTKSQRAGAVGGGEDRRGFDSVAGFMSIGGADVDPLSAFGVSSTDGALPAFKPAGRPSRRRRCEGVRPRDRECGRS